MLSNPLTAGISLLREQGARQTARSLVDRDAAIVRQYVPRSRTMEFEDQPFWAAEVRRIERGPQGHDFMAVKGVGSRGWTYTLHSIPSQCIPKSDRMSYENISGPYAAFGSPVTSISTVEIDGDILLFAASQERASPGNVFSGRLTPHNTHMSDDPPRSALQLTTSNFGTLGTTSSTTLWHTSISPLKTSVAVAGTLGIWTLAPDCTPLDRLSITRPDYAEPEDDETRALDWLDAHTLAAGSETVYLWDQRSGGASQRFRCKGRRVTGIVNPERGIHGGVAGQRLLVATNRALNLFDVRYLSKTRPVQSWRHEHEGPQISLSSNGMGLFAAVDRDAYVHVYSTRTGGEVARLARLQVGRGSGVPYNLRWCEDERGRMGLRALQGGGMVEWKWDGEDDG